MLYHYCIFGYGSAVRITKVRIQVINTFIKPIAAGIGMGIFSFLFYKIILWGTVNNTFATLSSIILSVLVYCSILFTIGGITREEIILLPRGEKLAAKLIKLGIIKE